MIWTDDLTLRLIELRSAPEEYTEVEIAAIMSEETATVISRNQVHGKIVGTNFESFVVDAPRTIYMPYYEKYEAIIRGKMLAPQKVMKIEGHVINDARDITTLKIGDFHIPFENDEYIQTACNRNRTADYIVIDEVMDCYSLSKFSKFENIPFEVEIDRTVRLYEYLSQTFPNAVIILLNTNHTDRVKKKMGELPQSLMFLMETDVNEVLTRPFPNIIPHPEWFIEINDAIYCHCERVSNAHLTRMGSVIRASTFFTDWGETLGLNDFRLIAQGHTHQVNVSYEQGGTCKVMETGCLCKPMDYPVEKAYGRPQVSGYGVVVQKDGHTVMNLTREYVLPMQPYEHTGDKR